MVESNFLPNICLNIIANGGSSGNSVKTELQEVSALLYCVKTEFKSLNMNSFLNSQRNYIQNLFSLNGIFIPIQISWGFLDIEPKYKVEKCYNTN